MSLALNNPTGDSVLYTSDDLEALIVASRESPRLRMMQPIQRSEEARVQRLLNAMQPGTYVRPHKHPLAHATETVVILRGKLGVLVFTEDGEVTRQEVLTAGCVFDLEPNVWHGMVCLEADTVMAEFKQGPYNGQTDKEFAQWSPPEGASEVAAFISSLETRF